MIWVFEKASGCLFFKGSSLARKSLKFCTNVAAVWTVFQEIAFNHLVIDLIKFLLHRLRDHFLNS